MAPKKSAKQSTAQTKPKIDLEFNRFYRYVELTDQLKKIASQFAHLVQLESIGKSHEGRDIWVVTITNRNTGPALEKPAFWADGNIHSIEVSASAACLYFLKYLLDNYGKNPEVTRAIDTRTFYICPRVNPDGAEWALADNPKYVRSSTRDYPFEYERIDGYEPRDMDGDGKILKIRIPDAHGHWKVHPSDKRLMVRRDPAEAGGKYYRILPEGAFVNPEHFDGTRIAVNRPRQGLDLNRNFPENWRGEAQQFGAGDYPTSEPEVKALVDFFISHKNICTISSYHTFSGVLLRPFGTRPDIDMAPEDLWVYKTIGQKGTDSSGYPAISVYEEFRYHPKEVITGTSDWTYEHLGIFAWVVEIWSPMREAGLKDYKYIDWFRDHPQEDDSKMLKWNDKKLKGKGFVPWRPFTHPQLGECEIGGWDTINYISNVPLELLEKEVAKFPEWMLWQALISPQLTIRKASIEPLSERLYKVRCEVQNAGYLPTYVSARALQNKVVEPVVVELNLPDGVRVVAASGNSGATYGALPRITLGQLPGWNHKHTGMSFWPDLAPTGDIAVAEWIIEKNPPLVSKAGQHRKAKEALVVELVAKHQRAGTARVSLTE